MGDIEQVGEREQNGGNNVLFVVMLMLYEIKPE